MPHTGTPPSKSIRGQDPPREVKGEKNPGPGRRFVPGVAAGICRRPNDRPRAETHPPNASINVCLVNSGKNCRSPGACFAAPLPVSLNGPAEPTGYRSLSAAHLPLHQRTRAANFTRYRTKMEAPGDASEDPELYYPEPGEQRDEDRLVDQVDEERVPPEREKRSRNHRRPLRHPLAAPVEDVTGEETDEDHPEPGEQRPVIRHNHVLGHDAEREKPRALRGDILSHHVRPDGEDEDAEKQVWQTVSQERVGEDYGDPDQVQDAERHDPHLQNEKHDGQRHPVGEDPEPPAEVLAEKTAAPHSGPRVADGERDTHQELEGARRSVREVCPEPGGGFDAVPAEVVQVVREMVDDHHHYGDPAGGVHLPESLLLCPAALRARLLARLYRPGS